LICLRWYGARASFFLKTQIDRIWSPAHNSFVIFLFGLERSVPNSNDQIRSLTKTIPPIVCPSFSFSLSKLATIGSGRGGWIGLWEIDRGDREQDLETNADSNEKPAIRAEDGTIKENSPLFSNNSDLKTVGEELFEKQEQSADQTINRRYSL
jgi:hypothetical protein